MVYTELSFFESVKSPCEVCEGRRYKDEVLEYKLKGKSIAEVLDMTVQQALEHFDEPKIRRILQTMSDVGLDYLTLGQPLNTLSGGESQRIQLTKFLGSNLTDSLYILDEPSIGLHQRDNARLIATLQNMRDIGNTV